MDPIEPIHFIGRAPPASVYMQNARFDELVRNADAEPLHAAARQPKRVQWYDASHSLNAQAAADRVEWFAETLGLRR